MFAINGHLSLVLTALLTTAATVAAVLLRLGSGSRRRLIEIVLRAALVLTAQTLAVTTIFLLVNNQYGFYSSWGDLLGQTSQRAGIVTNGVSKPLSGPSARLPSSPGRGDGTINTLAVRDTAAGALLKTEVWLPPQYAQTGAAAARYPVVMFLPGQPSAPSRVFRQYDFGAIASRAIAAGQVHPFVAIFPPLMTSPPRDTECTDVLGGRRR